MSKKICRRELRSVLGVGPARECEPSPCRMREIAAATPDHRDVPFRLRLREQNIANGRVAALFGDHPRQEGYAQSASDKLDDEVDLAASCGDGWLESSPPAGVEDDPIQREAALEPDEVLIPEEAAP